MRGGGTGFNDLPKRIYLIRLKVLSYNFVHGPYVKKPTVQMRTLRQKNPEGEVELITFNLIEGNYINEDNNIISTKNVYKCDFTDIFNFIENEYNISWDKCISMFFDNNILASKSFNEYNLFELFKFTSMYNSTVPTTVNSFKEFNKDEIINMNDTDKAYILIGMYMINKKIDNIFIDNKHI